MADPTFFDLFETPWAETGTVDIMTLPQYRAGWAFIGSLPPTVEQFNKLQQLNDQKLAWLFHQVKAVAVATEQEIGPGTLEILIHALQNLDMDKATAGTLGVARGGTGRSDLTQDTFIVGNGTNPVQQLMPTEALEMLGGAKKSEILPVASSEQAQAMTDDTVLMTPKKLADAFGGANQSLATVGHQKLPGGLILQWATVLSNSAGFAPWTYPIAFPNDCYSVVSAAGQQSGADNMTVSLIGTPSTVSTNSAVFVNGTQSSVAGQVSVRYLAWGR